MRSMKKTRHSFQTFFFAPKQIDLLVWFFHKYFEVPSHLHTVWGDAIEQVDQHMDPIPCIAVGIHVL